MHKTLLAAALALVLAAADKPQISRSEVRPQIMKFVEDISRDSKEHLGTEISEQKKTELVDSILKDMEAQGTYEFVK